MKYLHKFNHGLGDCIQLVAVLKSVPGEHDVEVPSDKASIFRGIARNINRDAGDYDRVIDHHWGECHSSWRDSPGTKTAKCLRDVFGIVPQWDKLKYTVLEYGDDWQRVNEYLKTLERGKGFVVLHYQGNTSADKKNLTHEQARDICRWLTDLDYTVLLLDWDRRSPLADGRRIINPGTDCPIWQGRGTGDGATIAALISQSKLSIVIDSGPGKVAYAVPTTPCISVWVKFSPYHYADNSHAVHVIPENHVDYLRGEKNTALSFFSDKYKYTTYHPRFGLVTTVLKEAAKMLNEEYKTDKPLSTTTLDFDYYRQHAEAGLDYLGHGGWQENYGRWLVDTYSLRNKTLLDVGCACGSIACGLAKAGALVSGIDPNEHMIHLGRSKWLRETLKICDAVNCHYWVDSTFDFIHSNQTAEHFKPELVPHILKELRRIARVGAIMFTVLDTQELYDEEGRDPATEDATHYCIKPMAWWHEEARKAGWIVSDELLEKAKEAPGSYFKLYPNWKGFVCVNSSK